MTLWILSPFSASYITYSIFTNCFLQRHYINTLYRQFKQMRYRSVVKTNIICFCRIGHTTSQFFAFFFKGGENGGNAVCREGSLHGKRDIRAISDAIFLVFYCFHYYFLVFFKFFKFFYYFCFIFYIVLYCFIKYCLQELICNKLI